MNSKMISKKKDTTQKNYHLYRPDWKLNCVINTTLQRNGVDCGCHALIIAENISKRSLNFDFQTKKINSYRGKMAFEIIEWKLRTFEVYQQIFST